MSTHLDATAEDMRKQFHRKLEQFSKSKNTFLIRTFKRYQQLIREVEEAKTKSKKTALDYRRLKRYDILLEGCVKKLIVPITANVSDIKYYISNDELFDVIHFAHLECGHAGRNRLEKALSVKYANITRDAICAYLELCAICEKKRSQLKKNPAVPKEIYTRAQVNLIDMNGSGDGDYRYIVNYQDNLTKFLVLRPLKEKSTERVIDVLIDIFCTFGSPSSLQFDCGWKFGSRIVEGIKDIWPGLSMVHEKLLSPESAEISNQDIQNILFSWMEDNKTNRWCDGLKFCQLHKNNEYHNEIQQTPFEAMFGRKPHNGVQTLSPVKTEEDLDIDMEMDSETNEGSDEHCSALNY